MKDINERHKYNLLFPFYSNEADELEKDAEKHLKVEKSETNNIIEVDDEDASSLEFLPYFHGDIKREEAELKLKEKNVGTFLIRFESKPNSFGLHKYFQGKKGTRRRRRHLRLVMEVKERNGT